MSESPDILVDRLGMRWAAPAPPGYAGVFYWMLVVDGAVDHDTLAECVADLAVREPSLAGRLVDRGDRFRQRLCWRPTPDGIPLEDVDLRSLPSGYSFDDVVDATYDRGRAGRDLTVDPPVRIVHGRLPDTRTLLGFEFHHAVADAHRVFVIIAGLLADYHRRRTGERPPWAEAAAIHSSVAPSTDARVASRLDFARSVREFDNRYPADRTRGVVGTAGDAPHQITTRIVLDEADAARARKAARDRQVSVTDVTLAALMLGIGDWWTARGEPLAVQRHSLPINQRARRVGGGRSGNSSINLGARPEDLDDPAELVADVARQRRDALDRGLDVRMAVVAERVMSLLDVRPLRSILDRTPLGGHDINPHTRTSMFSNLGVVWPELADGRPTGRSLIDAVAGLELVDLGLCAFSHGRLIVNPTTFGGRLMIFLSADGANVRAAELADLTARYEDRLRAFL